MTTIANTAVALVAILHFGFLVLEMFLWTNPWVFALSARRPICPSLEGARRESGPVQRLCRDRARMGSRSRRSGNLDQDFLPLLRGRRRRIRRIYRKPKDPLGPSATRRGGARPRTAGV